MLGHLSADGHLLMQLHWKVQMPSEDPHVAESSGTKAGATVSSPTAVLILTLRDPPRPGPAHPREHGDSAAPKSLDPQQ